MELIIAAGALLVAVVAFTHSRRVARKLAILEEQYWALKVEHGELKAKVDPALRTAPTPQQTFVPLIRRRPETPGDISETGRPAQK